MLRFFTALFGPVFAKEMVELARRKRYYFNRVFFGSVLALTVLTLWLESDWKAARYSAIKYMAELSEEIFIAVTVVQYLSTYVFVPLFLCGSVSTEREEGTLDLLFTTHLKDREIVLGKLGSRLAVFFVLMLCALPVLSILMLYGGVDPWGLMRMQLTSLVAMLYTGSMSIYFSTTTKSPMGALIRTYWWMAVWIFAVPMAIMIPLSVAMRGPPGVLGMSLIYTMMAVNPGGHFMCSLPNMYEQMRSLFGGNWELLYLGMFLTPVAWSTFLIWRAVARLRLPPSLILSVLARVTALRDLWLVWEDFFKRSDIASRRRAERFAFVTTISNPLWLRARIARVFDREKHIGRIQWLGWAVAIGFFVLMGMVEPRALRDREASMVFLVPTYIGITVMTTIFASMCFLGDRRRGFLDLVLITPLKPSELIDGTLGAVWQHLRRVYFLPWLLGLLFILTGSTYLNILCYSIVTASLYWLVVTLAGMACSLAARSMLDALLPTFVYVLFTLIGIAFFVPFFREMHGPVLWCFSACLLVGSGIWLRRKWSSIRVGVFLLACHLSITSAAACWTIQYNQRQNYRGFDFPMMAQHPAVMAVLPFGRRIQNDFGTVDWPMFYITQWAALGILALGIRWWTIHNFDKLAGREERNPGRPQPGLEAQPAPTLDLKVSLDQPAGA